MNIHIVDVNGDSIVIDADESIEQAACLLGFDNAPESIIDALENFISACVRGEYAGEYAAYLGFKSYETN